MTKQTQSEDALGNTGLMEAPILKTKRLILRPFVASDVEGLVREIMSDPDVLATLPEEPKTPHEQRICAQQDYIDGYSEPWVTKGYGGWAVCSLTSEIAAPGTILGWCGFTPSQPHSELNAAGAELAYGYGKAYWGKGIGYEAARLCVDWYFREGGHDHLDVCHYAGNAGSIRIIEMLGFTHIGDFDLWGSVASGRGLMPTYTLDRGTYNTPDQTRSSED
jgi:RimJ/RimL family protein N-acetyltransferase